MLRTRRPATHTAEQARRMRGVLSGMSLPITIDAEAVGTVRPPAIRTRCGA
ncbi:hypothetical protein [Streptomyces sp. NPDC057623]|uniref:hypothetical protein n=1 Tax=Streptomyces sp. NPDC057623 TaxID=3346187 RepID=UPI0036A0D1C3